MLFKANITQEVTKDREKLAEQLYLFLNEFAYTRLKYESRETVEDCIQDTIMYMLNRFDELNESSLSGINLEKYFYNRANSYISYWLKGRIKDRKKLSKFIENSVYISELKEDTYGNKTPREYIDEAILNYIVDKYPLGKSDRAYIIYESSMRLQELGFIGDDWIEKVEEVPHLKNLVYAIVDEYLVNAVEGEE